MMAWDDGLEDVTPGKAVTPRRGQSAPVPAAGDQGGFGADVVARGVGAFAGWPVDTINNIINLGGAAFGASEFPSLLSQVTGKPASSFRPSGQFDIQEAIPGLAGSRVITEQVRNALNVPFTGVAPTSSAQGFMGDVGVAGMGMLAGGGHALARGVTNMAANPTTVQLAKEALKFGSSMAIPATGSVAGERVGHSLVPNAERYPMANSVLQGALPALGSVVGGVASPSILAARGSALKLGYELLSNPDKRTELIQKAQSDPRLAKALEDSVNSALKQELRGDPKTYAHNLETALELQARIPGLKLDIGQMVQAPGLTGEVRRLWSQTPADINAKTAQDRTNLGVLRSKLIEGGSSEEQVGAILDRIIKGNESAIANAARGAEAAQQSARGIAETPKTDLEAAGSSIRRSRDAIKSELDSRVETAYQKARDTAAKEGAQYEAAPVFSKAQELLADRRGMFGPENIPAVAQYISRYEQGLSKSGEKGGVTVDPTTLQITTTSGKPAKPDFAALEGLKQALQQDINATRYDRSEASRYRGRQLRGLMDEVNALIESGPPETAKAFKEANALYAGEYVPKLLTGANLKAGQSAKGNEPLVQNEKLGDLYLRPNGAARMGQFLELYGNDKNALKTMRDIVLDRYANSAIDRTTGELKMNAHEKFLNDYAAPLRKLEEKGINVRQELADKGTAFKTLWDKADLLSSEAKQRTADPILKRISNDLGGKPMQKVAEEALKNPKVMNGILAKMTADEGKVFAGYMKEYFADRFSETVPGGETKIISPSKIGKFMDSSLGNTEFQSYRNMLVKAYGTEGAAKHIQTLRDVADAAQRISSTEIPASVMAKSGGLEAGGWFKEKFGFTGASLFAALRTVGRIQSPEYVAAAFGGTTFLKQYNALRNEVMKTALTDQNVAQNLKIIMNAPTGGSQASTSAMAKIVEKMPMIGKMLLGTDKYAEYGARQGPLLANDASEMADKRR